MFLQSSVSPDINWTSIVGVIILVSGFLGSILFGILGLYLDKRFNSFERRFLNVIKAEFTEKKTSELDKEHLKDKISDIKEDVKEIKNKLK